jgi:hypothetical protein
VAEVILDELKRDAGVEQMRRDRVPERMSGVVGFEPCTGAVPAEEVLDLALLERADPACEERLSRFCRGLHEVLAEKIRGGGEERPLGPVAALDPLDDDSMAGEVDIPAEEKPHLADPEAIVVNN